MFFTSLLLLTLSVGVVQTPSTAPSQPVAVRRCAPKLLGVVAEIGWAFVVGRAPHLTSAHPCPPQTPAPPVKEPARPVRQDEPELVSRLAKLPAHEALRQARFLYIRQRSSFFNKEKLERELLKRKEFAELGLEITRSASKAELILEITRKSFTTRFTCSIIEPSTERMIGGATASSLGGEIEPHLAEAILKQFKAVHSSPTSLDKKFE